MAALIANKTGVIHIAGSQPGTPTATITPHPNPTRTKHSGRDVSNGPNMDPALLKRALLPDQTLGSAATSVTSTKFLAQGVCGGPVTGTMATAGEFVRDRQTQQSIAESIIEWNSDADANRSIADDRNAVNKTGSCSYTSNNETSQFEGDYSGSPPSCTNSGNYLATQVFVTSSSIFSPGLVSGFLVETQCGNITITIEAEGGPGEGVSQNAADGYLSNAVGRLTRTLSSARAR